MSAAVVDGLYGILSALILNKMSSSFSTARYFLLALLIIIFCRPLSGGNGVAFYCFLSAPVVDGLYGFWRRSSAPLVRGAGKTEGFD